MVQYRDNHGGHNIGSGVRHTSLRMATQNSLLSRAPLPPESSTCPLAGRNSCFCQSVSSNLLGTVLSSLLQPELVKIIAVVDKAFPSESLTLYYFQRAFVLVTVLRYSQTETQVLKQIEEARLYGWSRGMCSKYVVDEDAARQENGIIEEEGIGWTEGSEIDREETSELPGQVGPVEVGMGQAGDDGLQRAAELAAAFELLVRARV